jgi:hypothetical protein
VPPEVTTGRDDVLEGVDEPPSEDPSPFEEEEEEEEEGEEVEELSTEPVPDVPPLPVTAEPPLLVAVVPVPGCSCARTIPMATVAPAAATTAPRVRPRRRAFAFSGLRGGSDWSGADISTRVPLLDRDAPNPTMPVCSRSQSRLWAS